MSILLSPQWEYGWRLRGDGEAGLVKILSLFDKDSFFKQKSNFSLKTFLTVSSDSKAWGPRRSPPARLWTADIILKHQDSQKCLNVLGRAAAPTRHDGMWGGWGQLNKNGYEMESETRRESAARRPRSPQAQREKPRLICHQVSGGFIDLLSFHSVSLFSSIFVAWTLQLSSVLQIFALWIITQIWSR